MPEQADPSKLPPPGGDQQRAENYVKQLVELLSENKLLATHTDLTKFDPSALQDHYRIDIKSYQLEVSHSKQPVTGKDTFVLLFINSPDVDDFYNAHGIIAYLVLNDDQFKRFKAIADEQIETRRKVEEEKRFARAVKPIDELLEKINKGQIDGTRPDPPKVEVAKAPEKKIESEPEPKSESKLESSPTPESEHKESSWIKPPEAIPAVPEPETIKTPPPTLADVQKALQEAAQDSKPAPTIDSDSKPEEKPETESKSESAPEVLKSEPEADHNLDIPKVETLPVEEKPAPEPAAVALETKPELNPLPEASQVVTPEPQVVAPEPQVETTFPVALEQTPPPALSDALPDFVPAPSPDVTPQLATPPQPETTPAESLAALLPSEPAPTTEPASQPSASIPEGNVLTYSTPTGSDALPPSGIDQAIDQAFQANSNNSITSQTPPIGTN